MLTLRGAVLKEKRTRVSKENLIVIQSRIIAHHHFLEPEKNSLFLSLRVSLSMIS